jgi:tetratricopeptide (TPR) repeat protein
VDEYSREAVVPAPKKAPFNPEPVRKPRSSSDNEGGGSSVFGKPQAPAKPAKASKPYESRKSTPVPEVKEKYPARRSTANNGGFKAGIPTALGILVAVSVLLVSAGATIFFFTKQPDDQRLFTQAEKELANGQYAFAVKSLNKAIELRPNDAKAYLALARAYVGIDQVDKAWDCISQAQQLGTGVVGEPALASELANYYRQRGQYEKAIDLLRPLAKANVPGKKAELADLDALWGDESLRSGSPELALRCWEEVRDLHEGSRYGEAEARLATVYGKLANVSASKKDDDKALGYLAKLNFIAQNAKNYELAASIYERDDKLELAIDQIRKALKLSGHDTALERKLVDLLSRRGKELLDSGDSDTGYAYLQQAKQLDPKGTVPNVTLKRLVANLDAGTHFPHLTGEVWNPTDTAINALVIKAELFDNSKSEVVWTKESKIVDEFVPPLGSRESRQFDFLANVPTKMNGQTEFRVYLDGSLYKSYLLGRKEDKAVKEDENVLGGDANAPTRIARPVESKVPQPDLRPAESNKTSESQAPSLAPLPGIAGSPTPGSSLPPPSKGSSAEEKTMKDLDF